MNKEEINQMKREISTLKEEIADAQAQIFNNLYLGIREYVGEGNEKLIGSFIVSVLPDSGTEGLILSPVLHKGVLNLPENPTKDDSLPVGFFIAEDYGDDVLEDIFSRIYGKVS